MDSFMAVDVGEETIAKIFSIVNSHPEGIMVEQIKARYGFTNTDAIYAALRVLKERGKVREVDPFRYTPSGEK